MKKSIMQLFAALVLVAGVSAYQAERSPVAASSCWWEESVCYTYGGFWMPQGGQQQCFNGEWQAPYICAYSAFGTMGPYWCGSGATCHICEDGQPCNG